MALARSRLTSAVQSILTPVVPWALSSLVVLVGLTFWGEALRDGDDRLSTRDDLAARMLRNNGSQYWEISVHGYRYHPDKRSRVAFFPVYPVLAAALSRLTGCSHRLALLGVANGCLALSFAFLAMYVRSRPIDRERPNVGWVLVVFGLWPTTFFMRMAYAESLFCGLILLTLVGLGRQWPGWVLAAVAGLATATRPVGVAVAAAVWWHVLTRPASWLQRLRTGLWLVPLSCWGLLAYMGYLQVTFGNALAFAQTQEHWRFAAPVGPTVVTKVGSLLTFEPLWGVYDPTSPRYWGRWEPHGNPLLSLLFWNPLFFLLAALVVVVGGYHRQLASYEVVLGLGLLVIPYATRAFEMSMASQGRFTSVIVPVYVLLGRVLERLPLAVAGAACGMLAVMLALWAALFGTGCRYFW